MSNTELLSRVRVTPVAVPEPQTVVVCKRCGCPDWKWGLGLYLEIRTMAKKALARNGNKELRCAGCGRKATIEEVKAIMESPAGVRAQELCGGRR